MKKIIFFTSLILVLSSRSEAVTYCDNFSKVEIKNNYLANFLDKSFRGCFSYFFDTKENKVTAPSTISFVIGDRSGHFDNATAMKISYGAFSVINNYIIDSNKLGTDTTQILNSIRSASIKSGKLIDYEIEKTLNLLSTDGLERINKNKLDIINESKTLDLKINSFSDRLKKEFPVVAVDITTPVVTFSSNQSKVDKEKNKWTSLDGFREIPFKSLSKIKNQELFEQILDEIKFARYIKTGKIKNEHLPYLTKLQKLENQNNKYISFYNYALKNISADDIYRDQKQFVLSTSYQLKKIYDQKLSEGNLEQAQDSIDMANLALEITTSLPVAATGRGLYEFITGKSLLTGRELSDFERGTALALALIDLTPQAWISKGVKGAWIASELASLLAKKGLIKLGFENVINIGINYSVEIVKTFSSLVNTGLLKSEMAKRIIEHRLFFKFLPEEEYLKSGAFKSNLLEMDKTLTSLAKDEVDQLSVESEQFIANRIKYAEEGAIVKSAEEVNEMLSSYYSLPPFKSGENVLMRKSKGNEVFLRYYSKESDPVGRWIVREKDIEGLSLLEIKEKLALKSTPVGYVQVELESGVELFEGIAGENFGETGGAWQVYIKSDILQSSWFKTTRD